MKSRARNGTESSSPVPHELGLAVAALRLRRERPTAVPRPPYSITHTFTIVVSGFGVNKLVVRLEVTSTEPVPSVMSLFRLQMATALTPRAVRLAFFLQELPRPAALLSWTGWSFICPRCWKAAGPEQRRSVSREAPGRHRFSQADRTGPNARRSATGCRGARLSRAPGFGRSAARAR